MCGQSIDRQNNGLAEPSLAGRKIVSVNKMTWLGANKGGACYNKIMKAHYITGGISKL